MYKEYGNTPFYIGAIVFIGLICLSIYFSTSSSDFEKGRRQLEQQGYVEVVNTGVKFYCCGKDDNFSTGFKCKNKQGDTVTGCFCSTYFKGVTIRFE